MNKTSLLSVFCYALILIPTGNYTPLLKTPSANVTTVNAFQIQSTPVTNGQFLSFVKANPKWQKNKVSSIFADKNYLKHWKNASTLGEKSPPNSPVVSVSWFAAKAYCEWQHKQLPTIAQWERVAAADARQEDGRKNEQYRKLILSWYGKPNQIPLPSVGKNKNYWGVYDMHGLVWEWVYDFNSILMTGELRQAQNLFCGSGAMKASDVADYPAFMRYVFRGSLEANYCLENLGFRCVEGPQSKDSVGLLSSRWTDQNGQKKQWSYFLGKPQLVAMIYTRCQYTCPLTIAKIKKTLDALPKPLQSKVGVVLISLDTEHDDAMALKSYENKHSLGANWTLLSGTEEQVRSLANVLKNRYKKINNTEFDHSMAISLLDKNGNIVLFQKEEDDVSAMVAEIQRLLE